MQIITLKVPGTGRLAKVPVLSRMGKQRLKRMVYYQANGEKASLTCRHFGIDRSTLYIWLKRYDPAGTP